MTQESPIESDKGSHKKRTLVSHYGVHEDAELGVPFFVSHTGSAINLLKLDSIKTKRLTLKPVNYITPVENKNYTPEIQYLISNLISYALMPLPKKDHRLVYIHESLIAGDWRVVIHNLTMLQQPVVTQNHLIPFWGTSVKIHRAEEILNSNTSSVCLFDMNLSGEGPQLRELAYLTSSAPGKITVVGSINPNLLKDTYINALPLDTPKLVCPEPACSWSEFGNAVLHEYLRELTWQKKT